MKVKDIVYCSANRNCDFKNKENMCIAIKPPIGIMSRDMWDRERQKDLADAMKRYLEAGMKIPAEWIKEYNEISDRLEEVKE